MVPSRSWSSVWGVAVSAALTVAGVDALLGRVSPRRALPEVEEALREFRRSDPHQVVLGSSHARTFDTVARELARRTSGAQTLLAVPLEYGKLTGYNWVLQRRLRPLIEEQGPAGRLVRSNLARFVLVTEWWDSCAAEDEQPAANLPSRAWELPDFLVDVAGNGLTPYNRNYLSTRWRRLWHGSVLVQDRTTHSRLRHDIRTALGGRNLKAERASERRLTERWQASVEAGDRCLFDADQMAALEEILNFVQGRGLEVTLLLYPRRPGTLTEKARAATLARFSGVMEELARSRGIRFLDLTLGGPLLDEDFSDDFDHLTAEGNRKFTDWALEHDLGYLTQPARPALTRRAGAAP